MEDQAWRQKPLNLSETTPDAQPARLAGQPVVERPVYEEFASRPVGADAKGIPAKKTEQQCKGVVVKRAIPEIPAQGGDLLVGDTAERNLAPVSAPSTIEKTPAQVLEPEVIPAEPAPDAPALSLEAGPQPPTVSEKETPPTDPLPAEPSEMPAPPGSPVMPVSAPPSVPAPPVAPKPLSNDAVIGHTAALWKYRPIPENEPEPAPEYRKTRQQYPGGKVIAARVRGKKHKHEGTNCDDWYEASSCGDLVFAAVSDGAGSKRFSRIGARESCRAAVGYLRKAFGDLLAGKPELLRDVARTFSDPRCMPACGEFAGVVQRAVLKAREAVEAAWYTRLTDPAYETALGRMPALTDFSATLLVSAVIPAGSAGHLVVSCQVGDGMSVLVNSRGTVESAVKLMGEADSGEFSGETDFLTSPKMASLETLQNRTKLSLGHSDTLLMMTDGVADDYFPPQREMRRLYFDLLANGVLRGPLDALTAEAMRYYQTLPPPVAYPWVNDQSVQVPLYYVRRILDAGATMEDLWANRMALAMAGLMSGEEDPDEKLQRWLDNYVERGSFDDRTLLAILL